MCLVKTSLLPSPSKSRPPLSDRLPPRARKPASRRIANGGVASGSVKMTWRPGWRGACEELSKIRTVRHMTGSELRRLRQAAGLTQKALAARLELNTNYLASLERGEAPIRAVVALAVRSVTARTPRRRSRGSHEG